MNEHRRNENTQNNEDIKKEFKNACKIVFDDEVIINDISIEDRSVKIIFVINRKKQ